MPQCLTFDCQDQLPGLGNCKLRARVDELQAVILALVRDAIPCNWNDTEHEAEHVAAGRCVGNAADLPGFLPMRSGFGQSVATWREIGVSLGRALVQDSPVFSCLCSTTAPRLW